MLFSRVDTVQSLRLPGEKPERMGKHAVWWPPSIDKALNAEAARRMHQSRLPFYGLKPTIVRDALRFYLGSRLVRAARASITFGAQLRAAREAADMSLRGVAAAADLSTSSVSQIESSTQEPSLRALQGLAKALDVVIVIDSDGVAIFERVGELPEAESGSS